MIRLVHFAPFAYIGGAEQLIHDLCKYRDRSAFDVTVVMPHDSVLGEEIRQTGVPVILGMNSQEALTAMKRADLINLHLTSRDERLRNIVKSARRPYVVTLHWPSILGNLPCLTICTSEFARCIQCPSGVPGDDGKEKFIVIPNGVDLDRFAPAPKRKKSERITLTRICRTPKCALYFWDSMKMVLSRYPQVDLQIVGNQVKQTSAGGRVRFLGQRRDIPEILAGTDVFVYAPYPKGGTKDLVVMEAGAMGVPCVVTNVNCVNESIRDGINGLLCPYGDRAAFAEKVGYLVEHPEEREKLGRTAMEIAHKEFDVRDTARCYETVYSTIVNR
jgi:glycosyltransferase involved in cell wall biosynthesis